MVFSILHRARNFRQFKANFLYLSVSLVTLTGLLIATVNARPIQDDYATLYLISDYGLSGFLELTWNTHGGNLTPLLINALFLYPSVYGLNFWLLSLFPIVNYLLLVFAIFSSFAFLNPFASRSFTRLQILTFANLVFLGSESLFSPQFLEMTLFTSAVLVHLWPILFFFLALGLFNRKSKVSIGIIPVLGFVSGNSNISEALFIQLSCILIFIWVRYRVGFEVHMRRLFLFAFSNLVGALMILAAPGFWTRASEKNQQGFPNEFSELVLRFVKSLAVFSADVLAHPMLFVFIIIGYKYSSTCNSFLRTISTFAVLLFILLFISLVVGATLAYPAWHQSIGLVVLSPFVGISLGDWLGSRMVFSRAVGVTISSLVVVIVFVSLSRAFLAIESRAERWDSAFAHNLCVVVSKKSEPLIGTETVYPISNLGIEDLNRWPWMRDAFSGWVTSTKFSDIDC